MDPRLRPRASERGLYAITAPELTQARGGLEAAVEAALRGGARWLQYRDKSASPAERLARALRLRSLCDRYDARLFVNDLPDLALDCAADGVHLGRDDPDPRQVRERLGERLRIGVSCYDQLDRAEAAVAAGADYIAFGAFFASPTKPLARRASLDLLRESARLGATRVAIGGLLPENAGPVIEAGAELLAVVSGVFGAEDIEAAARAYARLFEPAPGPPRPTR